MSAEAKELSELEYLRTLKENNTKTLQCYTEMIQTRQQVIERKDVLLHVIRAQVQTVLKMIEDSDSPSFLLPLVKPFQDIDANAQRALDIGIKPKE